MLARSLRFAWFAVPSVVLPPFAILSHPLHLSGSDLSCVLVDWPLANSLLARPPRFAWCALPSVMHPQHSVFSHCRPLSRADWSSLLVRLPLASLLFARPPRLPCFASHSVPLLPFSPPPPAFEPPCAYASPSARPRSTVSSGRASMLLSCWSAGLSEIFGNEFEVKDYLT
jgi:hypothetical protein